MVCHSEVEHLKYPDYYLSFYSFGKTVPHVGTLTCYLAYGCDVTDSLTRCSLLLSL